ncbi:tetratricopeptide repeat protein [Maribacter sp. PR1]|uniref:Tetratricopeptide repeat protein n=1 Tax=Maribacter cobaltidurans TaxID=1178778 RepID=A0ABU7IVB1_9FLAO|nr:MULTISPECIES: tetratricopeptide repeat protein [Maribacter]MDC6389426.1 tetratricopeptide repeat protein [Maribacter sp. PR1]MEE1976815.1 tetratricopeptide repeat protein [Maribacter cobaltidurans]
MKRYLYFLVLVLIFSCTNREVGHIAKAEDYNGYLSSNPAKTSSKYFKLWNSKIRPDSMQLTSFGIIGGEYNRYFKETGDITYLKKAEQSLERAVEIASIGRAGYRRSLARNYISQHRFKEALTLAQQAMEIGSDPVESQYLLFDIHMELGNYDEAEKYLDSTKNLKDFGYLIRLAKWNDYKGDLDTTINFMEKAKEIAIASKNESLIIWSVTNLADYYGHAGRIEDSYNNYLKALELDGNNAYAKKGIAWIAFSNDDNPEEAMRILDSITTTYNAPDYYLLKAEIADYLGQDFIRMKNLDTYFQITSNPAYGDMYNAYNLGLYLDETGQLEKGLRLAKKEVENRPTPESYSWLAYSYLKNGDKIKAKDLMDTYVANKTFEPALLYQVAEVYKANEDFEKVQELKNELVGAAYELGPIMEKQIQDL